MKTLAGFFQFFLIAAAEHWHRALSWIALFCAALFLIGAAGSHHGDVVASAMVDTDERGIFERVPCASCDGEGGICGRICNDCYGTGSIKIFRPIDPSEIQYDQEEEIPERVACIPCNGEGYICGKQCSNCRGYGSVKTHYAELQMYPDTEPDCTVKLHTFKK